LSYVSEWTTEYASLNEQQRLPFKSKSSAEGVIVQLMLTLIPEGISILAACRLIDLSDAEGSETGRHIQPVKKCKNSK